MRTKFVVVLLLVAAAIGAAPWVDGYLLKQNYYNTVAIMNQDSDLKAKIIDYQQGYLTSYAKIQFEATGNNMDHASPLELGMLKTALAGIVIEQRFSHGPFFMDPIKQEWRMGLGAIKTVVNVDILKQFLGNQVQNGLFQVNTVVGFGGDYLSQIQAPPISTEIPQVFKLSWGGLTGTVRFSFAKDHISEMRSDLSIGAFQMTGPQNQSINIAAYTMHSDLKFLSKNLWDGSYVIMAPSAKIVYAQDESVSIEGLNAQSSFGLGENPDLYNVQFNLDMNKLAMPEMTVNPFSIKTSAMSLDANVLSQIIKESSTLNNQNQMLFARLITASTVLSIAVNLNTPFGHFIANGQVNWKPNALPTRPEEVFSKSSAKADLRVSVGLVNQILEIIDTKAAATAQNQTANAPAAPQPSATQIFSSKLDELVAQQKITQQIDDQLTSLQKVGISQDVYSSTIDNLVTNNQISPDVADTLKAIYIQANQQAAMPVPSTPAQTSSASTTKPSDEARQQIANNIKLGYIIEQNGEYIVSITEDQGVVKINGKEYQVQPPSLNAEPAEPQQAS
jgi:hypothetical protein